MSLRRGKRREERLVDTIVRLLEGFGATGEIVVSQAPDQFRRKRSGVRGRSEEHGESLDEERIGVADDRGMGEGGDISFDARLSGDAEDDVGLAFGADEFLA